MTKKKAQLVSESVIRRWGKLAAMPALTENFIDNLDEMDDEEVEGEELPMPDEAEAAEMGAEMGAEEAPADPAEEAAVERIVAAVVDAISSETGVAVEVEGDAGAEDLGDQSADVDLEMGMEPEAELPEEELEVAGNRAYPANRDDDEEDEDLGTVVDDDDLSEAVLRRVVSRLLKNSK
jgi:hypothetical protein